MRGTEQLQGARRVVGETEYIGKVQMRRHTFVGAAHTSLHRAGSTDRAVTRTPV